MELKTTLNEEMTKRFEAVKKSTGLINNKDVLAFLIFKEFNRIQRTNGRKPFLEKETYDMAEKTARSRGQTVAEYVEKLVKEQIKEGVKYGN